MDLKRLNAASVRYANEILDRLEILDVLARKSSYESRRKAALAIAATQTFNRYTKHFGNMAADDKPKLYEHGIIQRLNEIVFFALHDGKLIYPDARGSRLPVKVTNDVAISLPSKGESLSITLPSFIRSGRIYFSNGDLQFFVVDIGDGNSLVQPSVTNLRDPNANVSWGFVEFTYIRNLLYANISYVDFVGLVLGMTLVAKDGCTQTTAGLEADAVIKICDDLSKQRKLDNHKWTSLCIADTAGKPIRVLSPGNQHDVDPEIFGSYWKTYVDRVWERYIARDLIIDTQSKAGMV
ncbi:Beta-1,3-glucanase, N-terminal, subdomain 2 [Fusarium oxysporum f. sp. vasinfectum]|nr:Beta-1,3-glucanase, N-terminal, subdomain 2 [Fusarium oxysporum f. sp. vasinfectum]